MEKSLVLITLISQIVHVVKEFHLLTVVICAFIFAAIYGDRIRSLVPIKQSKRRSAKSVRHHVNKLPGPACMPLLGNALLMATDREEMFNRLIAARKMYGRKPGLNRIWNGSVPYVIVSKAAAVERILNSSVNIEKGRDYDFLRPWLGDGLLTAPAAKWYHRRKALNPTFSYKMLTEFLEIFNQQATTMVRILEKELGNDRGFDCTRYATLYSLDVLCETAMGCPIHAQEQFESEYVKAHEEIGQIMLDRLQNIWLHPNLIFRFTESYKRQAKCLKVLHGFSEQVIAQRRRLQREALEYNSTKDTPSEIGQKRQLAFLDLLLETKQNGVPLTDQEIREEVDTFILGGHDTTATAIGWLLYLLGTNQQIQDRLFEEIDAVLGQDRDRPPTMGELNEMKYLDCCIKEALRLFPSIPIITRRLTEDVLIDQYTIPASANAIIVLYQLHRDPKVFPNPEKFDPDRFLPEVVQGRHQYAYIPFSGGPRNCIGQKFGLLEEKAIFTTILRKYRIESLDRREDITLYGELVLKSKHGLKIRIHRRN
ncbi:cytochrome P450 4c3-like [Topomyia yanbarensis]|uniref:cytochrome P450 4c3-like n=1 Tax=Topomyia yanbarensis TaxID=2498891 RepID=UPI00273B85E6|nr:cytochrome P450 4c3-like [Topomyia yanbarensis]